MEAVLVGRDRELQELTACLEQARAGRPQVVLVGGEAGIGKSRLVAALADRATAVGAVVAWGRTTELVGAPPYWPWLQVLEQLDASDILASGSVADPEPERFARFEAVAAVLRAASAESVLLVALEDVHRADEPSLRLLSHVTSRLDGASVLLIATHRSGIADHVAGLAGVVEEISRRPSASRLELTGLSLEAISRLLDIDREGGQDIVEQSVVEHVWDASGGNPLLVGELARHLAAGGDLATVPRSVRDAVSVRLAQRTDWCAEVVRTAAVIGRTFSAGLVATATQRPAIACLEALDEAQAAGLVEPTGVAGEFRFVHALVRDAVEAATPVSELPAVHRTIAQAIETYEGTGDALASDLARHWDAASVLGERETAARWCERAAAVANRQLAWEEAARLYDRALELEGGDADPLDTYARALGSAQARLHCDDVSASIERCVVAADAARDADRPDLFAEAALVPEGRGGPELLALWRISNEALERLPTDDHARRARLHGHLANLAFYIDPSALAPHAEAAVTEAELAGDLTADIAALVAQHMVMLGPQHAEARLDLAARLGDAARALGRPSIAIWEVLWRLDSLLELGRVQEALASLPALRRAAVEIGSPIARWHLSRAESVLAQAVGRFDDALEHAERARQLFALHEDEVGAEAMYLGFRSGLEMHAGWTAECSQRWDAIDLGQAPPFLGELPLLGPTVAHLGAGRTDQALRLYRRLSAAEGWAAPRPQNDNLWLHMYVVRIMAASWLGIVADLPPLLEAIGEFRGMHVASGGGAIAYEGCVELWLGVGARAVGDLDAADRDLAAAVEIAKAVGTPGFEVHARVERAEVLFARDGVADVASAREELAAAQATAARLRMPEFLARIDELRARLPRDEGPLSPRELEVAALVAEGRTNKEIAATLFVSERTAQNHMQHILTKLGLANRTQVAAWYRTARDAGTWSR